MHVYLRISEIFIENQQSFWFLLKFCFFFCKFEFFCLNLHKNAKNFCFCCFFLREKWGRAKLGRGYISNFQMGWIMHFSLVKIFLSLTKIVGLDYSNSKFLDIRSNPVSDRIRKNYSTTQGLTKLNLKIWPNENKHVKYATLVTKNVVNQNFVSKNS